MELARPDTLTVCRASAGTGKTFTLAANYVALLLSGESYRSILAVTFTNKATQEMKDRILLFLDNIADNTGSEAQSALNSVRARMIRNTNASDEDLRLRARECYNRMLEDYDNIHISTIDTFLMQLFNGLGQMLDDSSAGASVELDLEHLITVAVDNLLTRPVNNNETLSMYIANYVTERLEMGQDWDIRKHLIDIAKNLYDEAVQQMEAEGEIIFDADIILNYKKNCDWRQVPAFNELKEFYSLWQNWHTSDDGVSGMAFVDKAIEEIGTYLGNNCKAENMFRVFPDKKREMMIDEDGVAFKAKFKDPARAEQVYAAIRHLYDLCQTCLRAYNTHKATVALLNDMTLMTALRTEIQALLVEQNTVLLALTASKLHSAMSVGDADFILEKAGIRYRHIMLDEFQDTSVLQWENFKPLIEEILANGGTVFIVGDIKQSIYRWRNGDWTIMSNLDSSTPNIGAYFHDMSLRRNFRSSEQVVRFNLELFQKLTSLGYGNEFAAKIYDEQYADLDIKDFYKSGHEGGYVQLMLLPYQTSKDKHFQKEVRDRIMTDMFSVIESRLQNGDSASDMLILVRGHKDAELIVAKFNELALQSGLLAKTQIVSCDSFHLDTSRSVLFIIHSLRWLVIRDEVSRAYLKLVFSDFDVQILDTIKSPVPLSELVEEIIKLLPSHNILDLAYINAFLDGVHDFVAKYGANVADFLTYWEDKMHELSISAPNANAIKIMTIHAAKGLEEKNVFVPFCSWPMEVDRTDNVLWCDAKALCKTPVQKLKRVPIPMSAALANSEYEDEYKIEHTRQRLDNLNMLYVALTRARENLYIYAELLQKEEKKAFHETVAHLLYKACSQQLISQNDAFFLSFGSPTIAAQQTTSSAAGKMIDRCSFDNADTVQAQLHVGERSVVFQMSREAMDCLKYGVESDERTSHIDLGNLCHAIMEQMETREDSTAAINDAMMRGLIADTDTEREVRRLIDVAWSNLQMLDWFSGKWEVIREATFLSAEGELRPDRIMIDRATSTAIVLDYKFGQREKKHIQQVRGYMRIMTELQFRHVEGYLWYAQEVCLQPVKL